MIYLDLLIGVFVALGVTYIMSLIYCSYIDKEERQKKINLLKDMKHILLTNRQPGFCGAFLIASEMEYNKDLDAESLMIKKIPELYNYKPKKENCYTNAFWFKPYTHTERIEIINEIIKKLS